MKLISVIVLTSFLFILQNASEENILERRKRNIIVKGGPPYPHFPDSIMYYVSDDITQKLIVHPLINLEWRICVNFEKQNFEVNGIGINFYSSNTTDKVILSKSIDQPTRVYLTKKTLQNLRLVRYHIGVALGLTPEITRFDRDKYVKILWENIDKSYMSYFKQSNLNKKRIFNTAFDFGSIMLFDPYFGTKNGKPVYSSKISPYYEQMAGKFEDFSYNDIKILNDLYCNGLCKKDKVLCVNNGYLSSSCKSCTCPLVFSGPTCKNLAIHDNGCGPKKIFFASKKKQYIMGNSFKGNCFWSIYSRKLTSLEIVVEKMSYQPKYEFDEKDGLEIRHLFDKGTTGLILRGNYTNVRVRPISSNVILRYKAPFKYHELKISYREVKKNKLTLT
uniref:Metalloendopeptidase n=1 Tax=Strongyloides papillosus TaxID=174720 RepID=A0A0N5CDL3_STREA